LEEALSDLIGSFIKLQGSTLQWTHPSYRDLVIDELARDTPERTKFLTETNLEGLKIAISESGGVTGARRFPLIPDPVSQGEFRKKALQLMEQDYEALVPLMTILTSALLTSEIRRDHKQLLQEVLTDCLEVARQRFSEEKRWRIKETMISVERAQEVLDLDPLEWPILNAIWDQVTGELRTTLKSLTGEERDIVSRLDPDDVELFLIMGNLILDEKMSLNNTKSESLSLLNEILTMLTDYLETEASVEVDAESPSANQSNWEDLGWWHSVIAPYVRSSIGSVSSLKTVVSSLEEALDRLDDHRSDHEPDYYEARGRSASAQSFQIENLFSDL
jgi:hypothetical protein